MSGDCMSYRHLTADLTVINVKISFSFLFCLQIPIFAVLINAGNIFYLCFFLLKNCMPAAPHTGRLIQYCILKTIFDQ